MKRILPGRKLQADFRLVILHEALHLADRLTRHDNARHADGALRQFDFHLREAMAVGRDRAQGLRLGGAGGVQVDAVEVVARFLGRDGELGLVDQPLQLGGLKGEFVRHLARREIGKVTLRQRLQRKARAAGADRKRGAVARRFQDDLRPLGQLAHDVEEHMGRHRGRAAGASFGRNCIGDFDVEVGGFERELRTVGVQQDIGEDRNGIAPLDHAMDVAQRFQQFGTLDRDLHREIRCTGGRQTRRTTKVARRDAFGKPGPRSTPAFSRLFTRLGPPSAG